MATAKDVLNFCSSDARQGRQGREVSDDDDYQPLVDDYSDGSDCSEQEGGSDGSEQEASRRSSRGRGREFDDGILWHQDEEKEIEEESLLSGVQSLFVPATPGAVGAVVQYRLTRLDWVVILMSQL